MEVYTADTNFVENSAEKLKQRKISRKKKQFQRMSFNICGIKVNETRKKKSLATIATSTNRK